MANRHASIMFGNGFARAAEPVGKILVQSAQRGSHRRALTATKMNRERKLFWLQVQVVIVQHFLARASDADLTRGVAQLVVDSTARSPLSVGAGTRIGLAVGFKSNL